MVAVINAGRSLKSTLQYNENKLKEGSAELIHSVNYGKDTEQLGFTDKIRRLEKQAALNEKTKVNSVHISLNFDPSEKLSHAKLRNIAEAYMQKIGFGSQPYLVYEHRDASHPHIHIVTTNIQSDGNRIKLHNIGRNQSEKARKEIEKEFNLVKAQKEQLKQVYELKPVNVQKVIYGKNAPAGTKRAITDVLATVLPDYKYTSLPTLNAVLKQYNVIADQGSKESRIYKNGGLVYRVLNEKGEKVGVPIPASHIYFKPTLKFLQQKFAENELIPKHYQRVKNAVDMALLKHPPLTLKALVKALQKENIQLVVHQNAGGPVYGLTYVDQEKKCVFKGSDLGKPYSAQGILQRCAQEQRLQPEKTQPQKHAHHHGDETTGYMILVRIQPEKNLLEQLMQPEETEGLNYELREEQRRRKRKKLRH